MPNLFGTDGIRGEVGTELTVDLITRVGRALAAACADGSLGDPVDAPEVVVGRDTRASGPELTAAVASGLCAAGATVTDAGLLPTPAVAFLTAQRSAVAGVVVSASHNPPSDNGIKLFGPGGWKLPVATEEHLTALVNDGVPDRDGGRYQELPDALDPYLDHLMSTVGPLDGLEVIIDCANGAGAVAGPEALRRAGATVTALHTDLDGASINVGCGAMHPEVVAAEARRGNAIGVTLDGGADRVLLADEDGRVVDGDGIMALLAGDGNLHDVVVTVMTNQAMRRWAEDAGVKVHETDVGDRHVLTTMRSGGFRLGGEQSGHIIRLDHATTGDGVLCALGVCALVARSGRRLADLVPFRPFPQVLVNVPTPNRHLLDDASQVKRAIDEAERELEGRILVRPSGTEALVRVMVEADDAGRAAQVAEALAEVVRRELGTV